MDNENKSKYESTIKWVIEHYPFDKISNIFDITQNISDLKLPEEELGKVFDEYLKNNYELKEGKKYLKYTQDDYERIEKNKFNFNKIKISDWSKKMKEIRNRKLKSHKEIF